MNCQLDHLVIAAATLEQGAAWCAATLGVEPGPGGRHALMGTHNRLLALGGDAFPRAYLEIIAIDPEAPPPGRPRWFGLDRPALQAALRESPRLLHAVVRSPNIEMMRWGLINKGVDPGNLLVLERASPAGMLRWRLLVRDDGALPAGGALPTLIEWQGAHPADALPASGLGLRELQVRALPPALADVLRWRGPRFVPALRAEAQVPPLRAAAAVPPLRAENPVPALRAVVATPRGEVALDAWEPA